VELESFPIIMAYAKDQHKSYLFTLVMDELTRHIQHEGPGVYSLLMIYF